jgi:hypothetical protein
VKPYAQGGRPPRRDGDGPEIVLERVPNERWATRGSHTNAASEEEIAFNLYHFEVWLWSDCHKEDGRCAFNLDFLGRWRSAETMPELYRWVFDPFYEPLVEVTP